MKIFILKIFHIDLLHHLKEMAKIDDEIKTKFVNDKHRFITNLIYTSTWFQNGFADFLRPFNLSSPQFNILRILRGAKDWVSMNDIKQLMMDKSPNATRLSDKLLEKEFVKRKRSEEDRRVVYLSITQKGLDLLEEIDHADNVFFNTAMDNFSEEEARMISDILDRIRS